MRPRPMLRNPRGTSKTATANPSAVEDSEEKNVVVQSALYRVELSNRGGVVKTWQLNKYFDDQKPPHPLDLVNDSVAQQLGWPFSLVLTDPQLEAKANSATLSDRDSRNPQCSCLQVRVEARQWSHLFHRYPALAYTRPLKWICTGATGIWTSRKN